MTIQDVYLRSGDEQLVFDPVNAHFKAIGEFPELHTFIDLGYVATSVSIGPWLSPPDGSSSCLLAIAYASIGCCDAAASKKASVDGKDFKGGIGVYAVALSSEISCRIFHQTRFVSKPLNIIWNKCQQSTHHANVEHLECCDWITCLFENGDLEVLSVGIDKLVCLFAFTPEMIITCISTSQIIKVGSTHFFYISAATDSNELLLIKLTKSIEHHGALDPTKGHETDSGNAQASSSGEFRMVRTSEGLYRSSITYNTMLSHINYFSTSHVQSMAFLNTSISSTLLAVGSSTGAVTIWDTRFGKYGEISSYTVSNKPIYRLSWSRNGEYLLGYSNSLFVIDWLGTHSISHYESTPYQHQPICSGLSVNSANQCFMLIRNELLVFPFDQLVSSGPSLITGYEWSFNRDKTGPTRAELTPNGLGRGADTGHLDISAHDKTKADDKAGAKQVLDCLDCEISFGYSMLEEEGLVVSRFVKNYRSSRNLKRRKGGESGFLAFNISSLSLLDHSDYVLSPTCLDVSVQQVVLAGNSDYQLAGPFPQLTVYGGSSGIMHLILAFT